MTRRVRGEANPCREAPVVVSPEECTRMQRVHLVEGQTECLVSKVGSDFASGTGKRQKIQSRQLLTRREGEGNRRCAVRTRKFAHKKEQESWRAWRVHTSISTPRKIRPFRHCSTCQVCRAHQRLSPYHHRPMNPHATSQAPHPQCATQHGAAVSYIRQW